MDARNNPSRSEATTMSVIQHPAGVEFARITALLDRLDPTPGICSVPGCVHEHDGIHDHDGTHGHAMTAAA